jgi:hypothetical protein
MIEFERERPDPAALNAASAEPEDLSYKIEIWDGRRHRAERILARAASAQLANVIFQAACEEHPHAHLVLRHRARIVAERTARPER